MFYAETDELGGSSHPCLAHRRGPVAFDGLDADHELLGDLFRGVGLSDELQYLQLTGGEDVELLLFRTAAVDVVLDQGRYCGGVEVASGKPLSVSKTVAPLTAPMTSLVASPVFPPSDEAKPRVTCPGALEICVSGTA